MSELILKKKTDFLPAPEGLHNAVCVDVVNLGLVDTVWMNKVRKVHKVRIAWELDIEMPDGKGRFVAMNRYTFSMDPKSNLRKALKSWRGQDFTQEEMNGFDLEKIVGASCQILITHTEKEGVTYANISSILKAAKKLAPSGKYVRAKDREGYQDPASNQKEGVQEHPADDLDSESIPF